MSGFSITLLEIGFIIIMTVLVICASCLQCFDTVGWAAGRASDL